jgi:phasin family protein
MTDVADFAEFQKAGQKGFEAAVDSYGRLNRAFQALAARTTENAKKAFEDTTRTWEQLISAKSIEQVIEIQSQYAKRTYDNFVAEVSKFGEWYADVVQDASKPVEQAVKAEPSIKRKVA